MSKPVNFLPFALLQFFIIMSYHLHLFTLSHSQPPTSHLPLPLRLGWSKPLIYHLVYTNMDSGLWFSCIPCIFRILTHVSKMFDVSFIRRIGLLDKLVQVSSPILLALRWIDVIKELYLWFACCFAVIYCCLANKIFKTKLNFPLQFIFAFFRILCANKTFCCTLKKIISWHSYMLKSSLSQPCVMPY